MGGGLWQVICTSSPLCLFFVLVCSNTWYLNLLHSSASYACWILFLCLTASYLVAVARLSQEPLSADKPPGDEAGLGFRWELKSASQGQSHDPSTPGQAQPCDQQVCHGEETGLSFSLSVRVKVWISSTWPEDNGRERPLTVLSQAKVSPRYWERFSSRLGACTHPWSWPWAQDGLCAWGADTKSCWKW